MRLLHCMIKEVFKELNGSQNYLKKAMEYKMDYPELSKMYYDLSQSEMDHATKIKDHVMRYVDTKKREGKMTAEVEEFWSFEHQAMLDMMMSVKEMQTMYR